MSEISDDILMAYADGALDEAERRRVETVLNTSGETRKRLEVFTSTAALLKRELGPVLHWPLPDELADAIHNAPVAQRASSHGSVIKPSLRPTLWSRLNEMVSSSLPFGLVAAACSAALLIGGAAGWSLHTPTQATPAPALVALEDGKFIASPELSKVLDTQPSKAAALSSLAGQPVSITPVMTFATTDSRFCRQYDVAVENGARAAGLACRASGASWTIEAHSLLANAAPSGDGLSRPAGANTSPAIDAVADMLIEGPALTLDREAALIKNGWRD